MGQAQEAHVFIRLMGLALQKRGAKDKGVLVVLCKLLLKDAC